MSWRVEARAALGELALDVELSGEAGPVALIGPNGAGKTTLLRFIAGHPLAASGVIRVGDEVLFDSRAEVDLPAEARRVGYVPQGYGLFPHLSVLDNVAFGIDAGRAGTRATRRAAAARVLDRLECAELAPRRPATLSGGEQQRVALARALAVKPRLLLLDEPMAALDASSRRRMRGFLAEQLSTTGAATILVTHDSRDVAALAQRVFVMERGKVVQRGTPAELAAEPASDFVAEFFDAGPRPGNSGSPVG